jgi:uncharacterized protein
MSTGVQTLIGKFVWHDNNATDTTRAIDFYTSLLGWETELWKSGETEYPMIKAGGQSHGGFGPTQGGAPSHWLGHVLVEDVDETVNRVSAAGGNVLAEPFDIPDVGRIAVFADPQGAVVSAYAPSGDPPASEGTFVWDELVTSDLDAAKRFYGEVFGWTARDTDMGPEGSTYVIFQRGGDVDTAGALTLPDPAPPSHWMPYVAAADVDATAARVPELGGTVIREPFDVPEVGRLAILADPNGAVFGLFKPVDQ